jgi:hypothetical protein
MMSILMFFWWKAADYSQEKISGGILVARSDAYKEAGRTILGRPVG